MFLRVIEIIQFYKWTQLKEYGSVQLYIHEIRLQIFSKQRFWSFGKAISYRLIISLQNDSVSLKINLWTSLRNIQSYLLVSLRCKWIFDGHLFDRLGGSNNYAHYESSLNFRSLGVARNRMQCCINVVIVCFIKDFQN